MVIMSESVISDFLNSDPREAFGAHGLGLGLETWVGLFGSKAHQSH